LIETPATYIRDYHIQLKPGTKNQIAGWVQMDGTTLQQTLTLSIPEAAIEHKLKTDANGRAAFSIEADLELWSPQNPKLYQVVVASQNEQISDDIGFRSIEVKGKDILLNGQSIFL